MRIVQKVLLVLCCLVMVVIIPATAFLMAVQQSLLKPYHTLDYFDDSGIYEELQQMLPNTIKKDESFEQVQSDPNMSDVVDQVLQEQMTMERISSVVAFIHTEIWDYITGKDEQLDKLDISDIRSALLSAAEQDEMFVNKTIYADKFVSEIDWASFFKLDDKKMGAMQTFYHRIISVIVWNVVGLGILIGLCFLIQSDFRSVLKMLSIVCFISSGLLFVLLVAVELIGVGRLDGLLDLPEQLAMFEDNLLSVVRAAFIDFVSTLLVFTGVVLLAGYGLFLLRFLLSERERKDVDVAA